MLFWTQPQVVRLQQTVSVQQVAQCGAIQTRCIVMDKTTQDLGLAQTRPLMVPSRRPVETRLVTKNGGSIQILQWAIDRDRQIQQIQASAVSFISSGRH
ncbi:hypothetical protein MRX96_028367 [Rhipicephalus microplus]